MKPWNLIACVLCALCVLCGGLSGCRAPEDVRLNATAVSADASYQQGVILAAYPDANAMPEVVRRNLGAFRRIEAVQETVSAYLQHRAVDPNIAVLK